MNIMKRLIKILESRYNDLGFNEFIKLTLISFFKYEAIRVYWTNNKNNNLKTQNLYKNFDIRKGKAADLEEARSGIKPTPWEFMCDIYDNVEEFYIAEKYGSLKHISWVYYSEHPNRLLKLGPKDAEIKYCLTMPEFRGRGIYPLVLREIIRNNSQLGILNTYICVKDDNFSSIRGIEKAGYKFIKRIRLIKIMGVQITRKLDVRKL